MQYQLQSNHFFWEKGQGRKARSRFNLLLLEYGEYFFEDLSVYYYPVIPDGNVGSLTRCDGLKVQGRLKLCSRSLIFEPSEIRRPIIKFPFKNIVSPIESLQGPGPVFASEAKKLGINIACFFSFLSSSFFEMKGNDKVGPYKQIECTSSPGDRILFALLHTESASFVTKIEQLRSIHTTGERRGQALAEIMLLPIVTQSSIVKFDSSHLIDFHEKLLLREPVAVRKVKPLLLHPGVIMITEKRVYFQPAQLNHVGDSFQY